MLKFLFLFLLMLNTYVHSVAIFSENNSIESDCKDLGYPRCVFAHVWIVGGTGNKCSVDFNAAEEFTCTVKCANITSRSRCNSENDKCEWVDEKSADGKDDKSYCKRKPEMKSFLVPSKAPPQPPAQVVSTPIPTPIPTPSIDQQQLAAQQQALLMQQQLQQQQIMQQQMMMQSQMGMAMPG